MSKKLTITLVKSPIQCLPKHKATLVGLGGLRKINQKVHLEDSPCVRGMINQVSYLVEVKNADNAS